jgi:hypothetical protein
MKFSYKLKPWDKYLYIAGSVILLIASATLILLHPTKVDPYCIQNGTEYFYWNNETKQGFIISNPETICKMVIQNRTSKYYWCDDVQQGFIVTDPPTDFKLIRIIRDTCIDWEGI